MNDKLLVETAVLAGEIMLVSGAEIYRVEDTINHIFKKGEQTDIRSNCAVNRNFCDAQ